MFSGCLCLTKLALPLRMRRWSVGRSAQRIEEAEEEEEAGQVDVLEEADAEGGQRVGDGVDGPVGRNGGRGKAAGWSAADDTTVLAAVPSCAVAWHCGRAEL